MTAPRARPCIVCNVRVEGGKNRCPKHERGGARNRPCLVCGRSIPGGNFCPPHEPKVDEAERNARNPYRQAYKDPQYAKNRQHRYERARGKCEDCGRHVGPGEWESDHVISAREWLRRKLPGSPNDITNLRIRCIIPRPDAPRGCHGRKTATDRRA